MHLHELIFLIVFFSIVLSVLIYFVIFATKNARKKYQANSYKGLRRLSVKFKILDTFVSQGLFVWKNKEYDVVYDISMEEGTILFKIGDQLRIEAASRKSGTETIRFNQITPMATFEGFKAKNGYCKMRVYRRR